MGEAKGCCLWARAFAAGCDTSISRSIALPSFVNMMPAEQQHNGEHSMAEAVALSQYTNRSLVLYLRWRPATSSASREAQELFAQCLPQPAAQALKLTEKPSQCVTGHGHVSACTGKACTLAAMMFPYCAFFPCSRFVLACSTAATGTCIPAGISHPDQSRMVVPTQQGWWLQRCYDPG